MEHRVKLILSVGLVCFATTGWAQNIEYSDAGTVSCLEQAGDEFDPQACIGRSADDCMADTQGGYSTVLMGFCLSNELKFWDGFLNREYGFARSQARKVDTQNGAGNTLEHALRDTHYTTCNAHGSGFAMRPVILNVHSGGMDRGQVPPESVV